MGLFRRVSDIISANLNEMVDRFEDPEKMLNQAIREMEMAIRRAMDTAARVIANEKLLEKQLARQRRQIEHWQQRAAGCAKSGEDDPTRYALIRRRESEKLVAALQDELDQTRRVGEKSRRQIDAMRVKLHEALRKLVTLSAAKQTAVIQRQLATRMNAAVFSESAFGRFDRLCGNIERAEAEAEALYELSSDGESPDAGRDFEIEAELEALKNDGNR